MIKVSEISQASKNTRKERMKIMKVKVQGLKHEKAEFGLTGTQEWRKTKIRGWQFCKSKRIWMGDGKQSIYADS